MVLQLHLLIEERKCAYCAWAWMGSARTLQTSRRDETRQKPARPAPLCVSIMDEGVEKSARYDLNSRQLLETGVQGLCVKI